MALIQVRSTCEAGEVCPMLTFDTETGDVVISGPADPDAAEELGLPEGEGAIRVAASKVARLLYNLGPDTLRGEAPA